MEGAVDLRVISLRGSIFDLVQAKSAATAIVAADSDMATIDTLCDQSSNFWEDDKLFFNVGWSRVRSSRRGVHDAIKGKVSCWISLGDVPSPCAGSRLR